MSPTLFLSVAMGGAVGAVGRFLVTSAAGSWFGHGFPYGTMIVNVLGSFILGSVLEVMALAWSPGESTRAFLVVGLLGAFTTFSTFSLDTVSLIERGNYFLAVGYVSLSFVISILAFVLGMAIFRQLLA